MGEFAKWLLHEDQKELFDYLFAIVLNIAFLVLTALLLWSMGRATMVLSLAKAYWIFWTAVTLAATAPAQSTVALLASTTCQSAATAA
jgi:hypothetical protein